MDIMPFIATPPRIAKHKIQTKPGHHAQPETVRFQSPNPDGLGAETLNLIELKQRGNPEHLAAVQRPQFLMFVLYTAGRGEHLVDFVRYPVEAGAMIVVQPGNLHQFQLNDSMQADLLVVDPHFMLPERQAYLKPLLSAGPWPSCCRLDTQVSEELREICRQLRRDLDRKAPPALRQALARQRLYTWLLILRIAWDQIEASASGSAAIERLTGDFQALLEQHYANRWTVKDYARKLGCAERTLTRASLARANQTAKELIDARVVLEAKRCLAHSDDSVVAISLRLGFADASTMVQFFKRIAGLTPQAFRIGFRGRSG